LTKFNFNAIDVVATCVSQKPTHDIVLIIIINKAASKNANEDADQLHSSTVRKRELQEEG
jgi:hypothetical protein